MTCNQLIKENKKTIIKFEEFIKPKTENPNDNDNYEYIESYCHNIYTQINETIIALDLKNCSIIEKDLLYRQFEELFDLYFNILDANTNFFGWSIIEGQSQDFFDYEKSFIEPNKFTAKFINDIIINLKLNQTLKVRNKKVKNYKTWFDVGIKFADGEIYKFYDNGKGILGVELKKKVFGKESEDRFRTYTDCTLNNEIRENKQKNIFARTKAKTELIEVIEFCRKNNIEICEQFKERCRKIEIDI